MQEDTRDSFVEPTRTATEVARRCIVLYAVIAAGHDDARDALVEWLRREGVWDAVSPAESDFLLTESPTQRQRIQATWRVEALFPLLWSLGLFSELSSPQELCNVQIIRSALPPLLSSVGGFVSSAALRSDAQLHTANEEIYNVHWRVRNAQLRGCPPQPRLLPRMPVVDFDPPVESYNREVVQERHYALNWLIGYCGQDWDHITTDT